MEATAELVLVKFEKIMQSKSYSVIVLGTDEKKFAIYIEAKSGKTLQLYLTDATKTRPDTHALLNRIFQGLEVKVKQVVINDLQDTVYFARLFLEQRLADLVHIVEIDARPSDCIALALMHKCPIYCTKDVLEQAVALAT